MWSMWRISAHPLSSFRSVWLAQYYANALILEAQQKLPQELNMRLRQQVILGTIMAMPCARSHRVEGFH